VLQFLEGKSGVYWAPRTNNFIAQGTCQSFVFENDLRASQGVEMFGGIGGCVGGAPWGKVAIQAFGGGAGGACDMP